MNETMSISHFKLMSFCYKFRDLFFRDPHIFLRFHNYGLSHYNTKGVCRLGAPP